MVMPRFWNARSPVMLEKRAVLSSNETASRKRVTSRDHLVAYCMRSNVSAAAAAATSPMLTYQSVREIIQANRMIVEIRSAMRSAIPMRKRLGPKLSKRMLTTLGILASGLERTAKWGWTAHERRSTPSEAKRPAPHRAAGKMHGSWDYRD